MHKSDRPGNTHKSGVPHTERAAMICCMDGRFVDAHSKLATSYGAFQISMAGGGLAPLLQRDGKSSVGQFVDAYKVNPYDTIVIVIHVDCGKALLAVANGELQDYDPHSADDMRAAGEVAAQAINDGLVEAGFPELAYDILILDIVAGQNGVPESIILDRVMAVA